MKTVTLTVIKDGKPAKGARVVLSHPFNKKFILGNDGKISGQLADDFATVLNVMVKGEDFEMGTQLEIDVSDKTNYEIEV